MANLHPSYWAQVTPEKPAYIMANSGQVVTYRELDERSNQIAHLFRQCGLKPGDHIAFQMENNEHFFQIVWGAQRAGLIYTPIHTHLHRDEVEYILDNCRAKLFITSAKLRETALAIRPEQVPVESFFVLAGDLPGYREFLAAVADQPKTPIADQASGGHMMYSSGTTGKPKGILPDWLPEEFDDLPEMFKSGAGMMGYNQDTIYLAPAPLYHAAPMVAHFMTMAYGGTSIIMEKFDPEKALAAIERYKVNNSQWVPIMFVRLLRLPEEVRNKYDLSCLKRALHAAAPCPVDVKRQMIDWWGPIISEYYSASEAIGSTWINSAEWLEHPGSVGRALQGELHVVDDEGNELPAGDIGTIYFSGMQSFEYFDEPEKTNGAYNERGWATTGDVGYMDKDGYLYLTDRKHFMIISGGVNIYPQEIESVLATHPKVADIAVFGIPNQEFGEEVKAVVQPEDMGLAGPELERELIAWCREHLSHVKCPRSIDFTEALPRMDNGKLYKQKLRDEYLKAS